MAGIRKTALQLLFGVLMTAGPVDAALANEQGLSSMPIRGIVRPVNQASISIDIPVRVAKLYVREGHSFQKGDTLVLFDCERLKSEHAALAAVHREKLSELRRNTYLDKRGAVGQSDVEISRAHVEKANAEAQALAARLKQCKLVAPFNGKVAELHVNEHEIPSTGQAFISIVDESAFEIDLIVPSLWLRSHGANEPLKFTIDETGLDYEATVIRTGAAIDPVSQTIKLIAKFNRRYQGVMAGMSGSATFKQAVGPK